MSTQKIKDKIKALRDKVELFISQSDGDIESVHKIRTSSREILSLLNEQKLHSNDLKQILKLSNKIRDIDVLITQYLTKIPKEKKINIVLIKDILKEERKKELIVFFDYLKDFSTQNISFLQKEKKSNKKMELEYLSHKKKELHKYRIFIKNQLYLAKNAEKKDKEKIALLTQIKDLLGFINDNHNAIKMVKDMPLDSKEIKALKRFTKEQNLSYFNQVKELITIYENSL